MHPKKPPEGQRLFKAAAVEKKLCFNSAPSVLFLIKTAFGLHLAPVWKKKYRIQVTALFFGGGGISAEGTELDKEEVKMKVLSTMAQIHMLPHRFLQLRSILDV